MTLDSDGLLLIGRRVAWLPIKRPSVNDPTNSFTREMLPWCLISIGSPTRWYPRKLICETRQNDLTLMRHDPYDCERCPDGIWSYILTETFWSLRVWDIAAIVHFKLAWAGSVYTGDGN